MFWYTLKAGPLYKLGGACGLLHMLRLVTVSASPGPHELQAIVCVPTAPNGAAFALLAEAFELVGGTTG
jgi:hypothetical protein